jgi:RHS repeat-associated protein
MNTSRNFVLTILTSLLLLNRAAGADGNDVPNGVTGDFNGAITTAGSYDPLTGNASRLVEDIVVTGSVGAYPLKWDRILNTRAKVLGAGFGQAGGWSHSYDWKLKINHRAEPTPAPPNSSPPPEGTPDGTISYPDGRTADLLRPWDPDGCDAGAVGLVGMGADRLMDRGGGSYDLLLADGGVVKFSGPVSGNVARPLAREIIDPYGRSTTLTWVNYRLTQITEPAGRYLEIFYHSYPGIFGDIDFIDHVTANDGLGHVTQTVSYAYTNRPYLNYDTFYLTTVDYHDGTHAFYTYQDTNIPPLPGHPGVRDGLIRTCDDVRFAGPMKKIEYEFRPSSGGAGWGQILREKNADDHHFLSELEYSVLIGESWRKEHRPDGSTREFRWTDRWYMTSCSDFEGHWSSNVVIPVAPGNSHYQVTDARLNMTDSEVEGISGFARTVRVTHPAPDNSFSTMIYSDPLRPHYLEYSTDENGKSTHYFRDDHHRVRRIEYPDYPANGFEEFTYNDFDQILTHTMTSGGVEHFEYYDDDRGLKKLSWPPATSSDGNPGGHPTQYFYYGGPSGPGGEAPATQMRPDITDRLLRVIDPRGNSTWYDYNPRGQVTCVTHEDGTSIRSDYNDDGTLAWTTDELGHTTTYTHDDYKRVTVVQNHLGETVTNSYAPWNGPGALSHTTSAVYQTSGTLEHVDYDYDHNYRRLAVIQAPGTVDQAITTSTYDWAGNLETLKEPNGQDGGPNVGKLTTFHYDCRNRQDWIKNALDEVTQIKHDPVGNKTQETRPDTTLRSWDYDSMNRLWHAYDWRPTETPTLAQTTTYVRDHAGNALSITDTKGAVYGFGYDVLNRKTSATYPQDWTLQGRTEAWLYDFAGNVKLHKNPANQYQHFEYDSRNRQRRSYWNMSTNDNMAAIFSIGMDTRTTLDVASRITEIQTNDGATTVGLGYDDANRKLWEDQTVAGQPTHRVKAVLDPDGRRTTLQIIDPPAEGNAFVVSPEMSGSGLYSISYTYTHRNQVLRIQGESGEDWAFNYTYDASGNMKTRTATSSSGQSSATNCPSYDALNRPEKWEQTGAGGRFSLSHYQYDHMNREEATWRDEECYLGECGLGERFTYEPTNQLASVKYNAKNVSTSAGQNAERSVDYAYTINKLNRSSMTDTPRSGPVIVKNYSLNELNQYTGVGGMSYTYDANFNLTSTGAFFGIYDAANRLVSASNSGLPGGEAPEAVAVLAEFVYDGLGRCVKRTLNNVVTVFVYDGWKPIAEWYGAKSAYFQAWNVYGPGADEILLRQQGDIGYVRFHMDRHGNVAFLVWNNGEVLEKCSYDAFGRATVRDANGGRPRSWSYYAHGFLFQGREYIRELGIYDYRNRFYHPETGRFLQTDPKGFDAGDMNLFRYVSDDPVDLSDPFGLDSDVFLIREYANRDAPSKYVIRNDAGKQVYSGNANQNPFFKGTHGIRQGEYTLQQRGNTWGKGYPADQPAITGTGAGLKPGQPNSSYKAPALVHKALPYGSGPDSAACVTVSDEAVSLTKEVMAHDRSLGATTRMHIVEPPPGKMPIKRAESLKDSPDTSGGRGLGGNSANIGDSRPSAGEVDATHQATGVPSLAQESVNVVNGPR